MKKSAIISSLALGSLMTMGSVQAATSNPFSVNKMAKAHTTTSQTKANEAKCGEGKCGATTNTEKKKAEAKCGEGKCGS